MPKIKQILGLVEDEESKFKSKFNKNDLFSIDKSYQGDARKTFLDLTKYGLSKKTAKLSKNRNLQLRKNLSLSDKEYLIMIPFFINQGRVSVDSIIRLVKGDSTLVVPIFSTLLELYEKNYIIAFAEEGNVSFTLSMDIIDYLTSDKEYISKEEKKSLKQIIKTIDTFANLYNNTKNLSMLGEVQILKILEKNSDYEYCRELLDLFIYCKNTGNDCYKFVFYILSHLILHTEDSIVDKDCGYIEMFINADHTREDIINALFLNDHHTLFHRKIFERSIDDSGKADKNKIEIHPDFKRKYLMNIIREKRLDDVIKNEKIISKEMFYNSKNENQIKDLTAILEQDNFFNVKQRLKDSGSRMGFACLFCGHAGTGKTETVLQIAKKTGRDIMKVDMSTLRSKWWGEDEKNVKAIFTNYKSALQEAKIEPILLLNEADAIIGKRLDVTGHNGAIITSINATQNIILEELENFEGILIATTNLTQNMDSAFERRFLYKIDFEKPNLENKQKLWQSILKLEENDAYQLASQFDFTGAQIENVFRKKTANSILYGNEYDLDKIIQLCKEENIDSEKVIGFRS